jgi:hypothetical protein
MTNTMTRAAALLATITAPVVLALALLSSCAQGVEHRVGEVMVGPTMVAAALSEQGCAALVGSRDSEHFDECALAVEDARCEREGWCK